jgi:hypothetical protein
MPFFVGVIRVPEYGAIIAKNIFFFQSVPDEIGGFAQVQLFHHIGPVAFDGAGAGQPCLFR